MPRGENGRCFASIHDGSLLSIRSKVIPERESGRAVALLEKLTNLVLCR